MPHVLIGLFVLINFPNLVVIKFNVFTLSQKQVYRSEMFKPTYEFLLFVDLVIESGKCDAGSHLLTSDW